jgi:hypothetical protein
MHVVGGAALAHQEQHSHSQDPPPPERQRSNARASNPCKNVIISFSQYLCFLCLLY